MTLIETMIALAILFTITVGLMAMATVAIMTTENQGHLGARTAEYAQDKMEQLLSLAYTDGDLKPPPDASDTASAACFPKICDTGGTGLAAGGSLDFNAPVDGYVDYLDRDGLPLGGGVAPPDGWFYMRVWQVEEFTPPPAAATSVNYKQITVSCRTAFVVGSGDVGKSPVATLTTFKSGPF
jgi:hypothetical protein